MQAVITKPVSELENNIREIIRNSFETEESFVYKDEDLSNIFVSSIKYSETDEQRARILTRLWEGELNPNNKNRQVCAREYLLSVKKRIQTRYNV